MGINCHFIVSRGSVSWFRVDAGDFSAALLSIWLMLAVGKLTNKIVTSSGLVHRLLVRCHDHRKHCVFLWFLEKTMERSAVEHCIVRHCTYCATLYRDVSVRVLIQCNRRRATVSHVQN